MKTFKGTFANGVEYMGVEVPETSFDFRTQYEDKYTMLYGRDAAKPYVSPMNGETDYDEHVLGLICETSRSEPIPQFTALGKYFPGKGVEFEVHNDFVDNYNVATWGTDYNETFYKDYLSTEQDVFVLKTAKDSLRSLLDRDSRQKFPLDTVPKINEDDEDEGVLGLCDAVAEKRMESQVRPRCFVILICGSLG